MAKGVNKVILIGNLGNEPEVRYTTAGMAICSFSVATSETWSDKGSGEKQERTEWHRVKAFGKLGEIAGEYLTKGRQVYVEGAIRSDKYTDKSGVERYSFDIIASEIQFLGGGAEGGQHGGGSGGRQQSGSGDRGGRQAAGAQRQAASREPAQREAAAPVSSPSGRNVGFEDDEIPF